MPGLGEQLTAILVLGEARVHECEYGRKGREHAGKRRRDPSLLEEVAGLEPEGRFKELALYLDRRAHAGKTQLLGLPLDRQVEPLGAEVYLAAPP